MRFISQYPGYRFQVRPQRQKALGDGGMEITQEPLYAVFQAVYGGAVIYENELAESLRHFSFHGNTQLQDEATPSDPMLRLSVFDTQEAALSEQWDAETLALVEARLVRASQESPMEVLMVTDTPIAAPFPAYDSWDGPEVERLIVKLIEDGHDLALVLHYERTFGPKRPQIIEALEQSVEQQKELIVSA